MKNTSINVHNGESNIWNVKIRLRVRAMIGLVKMLNNTNKIHQVECNWWSNLNTSIFNPISQIINWVIVWQIAKFVIFFAECNNLIWMCIIWRMCIIRNLRQILESRNTQKTLIAILLSFTPSGRCDSCTWQVLSCNHLWHIIK